MTAAEKMGFMADGRAAWNRGDFFAAHEHWEAVWRVAEGPERRWLQGLIQVAAGLHQLVRGRTGPAGRLVERALVKLADAPARLEGVDVTAVRGAGERLLRGDPSSVTLA